MTTSHVTGSRLRYDDAPPAVHRQVERMLGGPVERVVDCAGGMSPGPAARLRSVEGRRAFVKACGPELNPRTPDLLRVEAAVLAALPRHPPLPRLLDVHDDGAWVVLVIEDIPGALPRLPWRREDVQRVAEAVTQVRPLLDAVVVPGVPSALDHAPVFLARWRELGPHLEHLDPWWARHHEALGGLARRVPDLIAGDALLHWDLRADNVLLTPTRTVLVDWGQARRGAPWMDHALLALDLTLSGGELTTEDFVTLNPFLRQRDPRDLPSLAAAVAMSCAQRSTQPGMPTMPALSKRWANALRGYLTRVLGLP